MNKIESTGKNIEQAIENALLELKISRDDLDFEIVSEGGLFKKAKILAWASEETVNKAGKIFVSAKNNETEKNEKKLFETAMKELEKKPVKKFESKKPADQPDEIKSSFSDKQINIEFTKVEKTTDPDAEMGKAGKAFLEGLCNELSLKAQTEVSFNGKDIYFDVVGEDLSVLIGYRGETLYAIQYLLTVLETREDRSVNKVFLNIDKYKEERETHLIELAKRQAERAVKTGRPVKLDPMNSFERKIVHTALQEFEGIETHSEGEEPNRYLIISKK